MKQRINVFEKHAKKFNGLHALGAHLSKSSVGQSLLELVYFRVSQINGCAFCLDMHSKDLRAKGETEQRLYALNAWRETPFFIDRERSALAWAEAVTACHVPDDVYEEALRHFTEEELVDLTLGAIAINGYNRVNVAFRTPAGGYQPGQFEEQAKQVAIL